MEKERNNQVLSSLSQDQIQILAKKEDL